MCIRDRAKGTAARLMEESNGHKQRVIATAEGDASRFKQIQVEYAKAPEVTRQRMYLETMQQVYANTSKVLVDAKGQGNLLYLPLDKLMQGAAAVTAAQAGTAETPSVAGAVAKSTSGQLSTCLLYTSLVVAEVRGPRHSPDPKTFAGKGKVQEIAAMLAATESDLVIFNHELSPAQERNLERELKCRVFDRTSLILDIFAPVSYTHLDVYKRQHLGPIARFQLSGANRWR